jgi:hypothetical protein
MTTGVQEKNQEQTVDNNTLMLNLLNRLMARVEYLEGMVQQGGKSKGGRKEAQPVLDTKTGKAYHSKASAGMAVCKEFKDKDGKALSPTKPDGTPNSFVWYAIPEADRNARFKSISVDEYNKKANK